MIVTDTLVFIHLHKSGGTFVNALLLHCAPGARSIGYHLPYRELPPAFGDLPVLGLVRNPWAYYVSWFHFQQGSRWQNPLFRLCSDGGTLGFDATVTNLANLHADTRRLDLLEQACHDTFQSAGLNLTKRCVADLRRSGVGFYTFLHDRMYAGADPLSVVRTEHLRGELAATLRRIGGLPEDRVDEFLRRAPPMNVSRHGHYRDYYGPILRDLVAERDRSVIERYDHRF